MNGQNNEGSKLSRFFGGGTSKKRQRLVMATSSGRVLICGDEKKAKFEIPLADEGTTWKKLQDPKGLSYWVIETVSLNFQSNLDKLTHSQRDKHFTFEDPKASSSDSSTTSASADDWIEQLEKAREMAMPQGVTGTDPGDESWRDLRPSNASSSANTLDRGAERRANAAEGSAGSSRHTLQKFPASGNGEETRGFKRFSRRASKSGLAAVF
jgi:3-phosphoinositide dependent protein kinase-1